jgi:hypothetical protein
MYKYIKLITISVLIGTLYYFILTLIFGHHWPEGLDIIYLVIMFLIVEKIITKIFYNQDEN